MLAAVLLWAAWSAAPPARAQVPDPDAPRVYRVRGVRDAPGRSALAASGAAILEVGPDSVLIEATPDEIRGLRRARFAIALAPARMQIQGFPPADSAYHDHAEMLAELQQVQSDHPDIFALFSIGVSHEGRSVWAGKISDHVAIDENEPEVLLVHHQHAREHLTVEQALDTLHWLTDGYGVDAQLTALVDEREIWIVFDANPDGGEYDVAAGSYRAWRKNRQPNPGRSVGTDLNRNWGYRWGCCRGSSKSRGSLTYRGAAPFSAPETRVVRDFVDSRVIGGQQQISVAIDFHSYGGLILWPYGYTMADVARDMDPDDQAVLAALGRSMAALNGYLPEQASDLYIADGALDDWLYGAHGILAYTFELNPQTSAGGGFYPPDEAIPVETARNRSAILYLLQRADCPYRAIARQAEHCGAPAPALLWSEDFDGPPGGWTLDPDGTDTARRGRWEIGEPGTTRSHGAKQLRAHSGSSDLVTGRLARSAKSSDLDGGTTSARSDPIALGAGFGAIALTFQSYLAHGRSASEADFLRVKVLGSPDAVVYEQRGAREDRDARWLLSGADLSAYAGQTIQLQLECADGGRESLVECAVDTLEIHGSP